MVTGMNRVDAFSDLVYLCVWFCVWLGVWLGAIYINMIDWLDSNTFLV